MVVIVRFHCQCILAQQLGLLGVLNLCKPPGVGFNLPGCAGWKSNQSKIAWPGWLLSNTLGAVHGSVSSPFLLLEPQLVCPRRNRTVKSGFFNLFGPRFLFCLWVRCFVKNLLGLLTPRESLTLLLYHIYCVEIVGHIVSKWDPKFVPSLFH